MQRALRNRRERPRADQHDVIVPENEPHIPAPAAAPAPAEPVPNPPVVPPHPPALAPVPPALPPFFGPPPTRQKDPPLFRGTREEDVVSWMFRFAQVADYNQWTAEQRLRIIGMSFEGVAQKWYYGLMLRDRPPETFEALQAELFRAFKPVNYEDHLEVRLRSRQQGAGEPFTDYFHDILYMCSRIEPNMGDRAKIQHLYRGLPSATVRGIYRFITPTSTTEDFFREVQVFLQGEDMASRRESPSFPQTPVYHIGEEKRLHTDSPSSQEPTPHASGFVTKSDLEVFGQNLLSKILQERSDARPERRRSESRAENWATGGPTEGGMRNKRARDGRPICNKCNRPGHIERNCYSQTRMPDARENTRASTEVSPKSDLDVSSE
ncbi:hypothetical protein GHT06_001521 [Daphnia sinensis]|uniref:CCHC-type domain-containing protein n=1 Tax=Daphnia sinensis TaxID=1820382 RepID=A0AAD5PL83_9CRUS|nr:hypothetical protein GHT06_001521 [Daphnia sinensis]